MLASTARHQLRRQLTAAVRPLSTSPVLESFKLPNLGEITHSKQNSAAFKERLNVFRESQRPKPKLETEEDADTATPPGIVKSIIYGSEKGQREEAEMEQSYSKVLARGKYVHAIEIHNVKCDKHAEYIELVGNAYPLIAADKENNCHLVGSWKSEIGDCDTFGESMLVSLFEYG